MWTIPEAPCDRCAIATPRHSRHPRVLLGDMIAAPHSKRDPEKTRESCIDGSSSVVLMRIEAHIVGSLRRGSVLHRVRRGTCITCITHFNPAPELFLVEI